MDTHDFNEDRDLESDFAKAMTAFRPPPELKESARQRLFGQTARPSASPRPRFKRTRTRALALGATVTALLAGVVIWRSQSGPELLGVAYAEFSAVLDKSNQAEWVHYFEGDREIWMSYRPYRYYERSQSSIVGRDRSTNREHWYDTADGTLTVRYMSPPSGHSPEFFFSFADAMLGKLEESGREVRRGSDTLDGKTVIVYVVTATRDGKKETLKYYVDPKTDRIIGAEAASGWQTWRMTIDYPVEGPKSVYELGVPRDAKIIDEAPSPDVLGLVQRVEKAAKAGRRQFYQVSIQIFHSFSEKYPPNAGATVNVTHYKDGLHREARYHVPCPRPIDRQQAAQYLKKLHGDIPTDSLESIEDWLGNRKPYKILVSDTVRCTIYELSEKGKLRTSTLSNAYYGKYLGTKAWRRPNELDGRSLLLPEEDGQWGKLVGIQDYDRSKVRRWYFNPDRDYLCEKREIRHPNAHESWPGKIDSFEVLEYAKTPGGRWFPKHIRQTKYGGRETILHTNFQDDRPGIEPQAFDRSRITAEDLAPQ